MGLEIIKKIRLEPKIENRSDLDETLHSHHQCSQFAWWEWSGGLKIANKGKPKFPTLCKNHEILKKHRNNKKNIVVFVYSCIFMKNILSWSKFSQEFDGINEKSPNS